MVPDARNAGLDLLLYSKTALRMYREGRFHEYEEARRELAPQGIRARALKKRMDEMFPPLSEEEIRARQAAGQAPSEDEVRLLVERWQTARSRRAGKSGGTMRLYRRSQFSSPQQQVTALQEVDWIKNNLAVKNVKPRDAPSPGAWAMLEAYRRSPSAAQTFFERIYSAVIPRKGEAQSAERFKDDQRKLDDMQDGVMRMAQVAVERAKEQWDRLRAQAGLPDEAQLMMGRALPNRDSPAAAISE